MTSSLVEPSFTPPAPVAFDVYIGLLQAFLTQRSAIVERIDGVLNCQKLPVEYQQDQSSLSRQIKDCFFALPTSSRDHSQLRDHLEFAHWHHGFKPRANTGNDIIDPAALAARAFHLWRQTRWPGQKGRVRYANTLFNVYVLRCLALLMMRLWDEDASGVSQRLAMAQGLLDALWSTSPGDQPVLVRNVRWLIPVAISPTTDDLSGYFRVAQHIADTFTEHDQVETQKAWVQTAGGHLRSQLRHLSVQRGVTVDDHNLVLLTRVSNALDIALLMEGLVTLLRAYQRALNSDDEHERLTLCAAICEGVSPDPELFLNRLDLLGPYTMIEHLFIATDDGGRVSYTAMGERHLQLFAEYKQLIVALAPGLHDDCQRNRPGDGMYSPYGGLYGFSSNVLELMAFKTLQLDAEMRFSIEDAFTNGGADKRAWVSQWRDLPHIPREVVRQFEYPQEFAERMHERVEQALQRCVANNEVNRAVSFGELHFASTDDVDSRLRGNDEINALPSRYITSSDPHIIASGEAEPQSEADLLYCRLEGEFLISYPTTHGWVGISKDVLTEVLGQGNDATLVGLPKPAQDTLRLMLAVSSQPSL